jgi:hypothetical protein
MEVRLFCATCGKSKEFEIDWDKVWVVYSIELMIRILGWQVEVNGDNIDIYCSKKCAA